MNIKAHHGFFSVLLIFLVIFLLFIYWLAPFRDEIISGSTGNTNFSVSENFFEEMQFYPLMRFAESQLSYKIYPECDLKKQQEMLRAFEILEKETILSFYKVSDNEDITIYCSDRHRFEENYFIAGEGGPTKVIMTNKFNVIFHGKIVLIKNSNCQMPIVALHELLHVLGFKHSENPNNIMFNISNCKQTLGEDIPIYINELYSVKNLPDIKLENVSAIIKSRYLNANMSVINQGLKDAPPSKLIIYADKELIKEIEISELEIGKGTFFMISNVWIPVRNFNEIIFEIVTNFEELEKRNNKIILTI